MNEEKISLTNEQLKKKFSSSFALVSQGILRAKERLKEGLSIDLNQVVDDLFCEGERKASS